MIQNAGLSVGALLRSRREELGQDTESVSRQLRIRAIYLRAIEDGRIQDLPGSAYAVGFVRSYADFLGFDGNSVVASFRDELGQRGRPETVSWQIEDKDGGFPFGKILVVLLVIAAAGYGLWYYLANTQSGSGLIEAVPEYLKKSTGVEKPAASEGQSGGANQPAGAGTPESQATTPASPGQAQTQAIQSPENTANQAAAPTPGMTPEATAGNSATVPATPANPPAAPDQRGENAAGQTGTAVPPAATEAPATTPSTSPAVPQPSATAGQPSPAGQAAATPAAPAAAQNTAGSEAAPEVTAAASSPTTRISIHAKLESWVQINDKDGKPVISRVLRAGETYAVPDEKGLILNTGNAGGIDLAVDGKTLPSLGSIGLVKRNIALDADRLATGGAPVKAPATKPDGSTEGAAPTGD
ncbi:MAG TPA: RodZ domain-containing protein [Dongiaceae bacterium]|nr:RodZ domain-containing protein [Dongiaceae bacterium]